MLNRMSDLDLRPRHTESLQAFVSAFCYLPILELSSGPDSLLDLVQLLVADTGSPD